MNNISDFSVVCSVSPALACDQMDGRISPGGMERVVDGLGANRESAGYREVRQALLGVC